jgi:hypothetical protein
MFNPNYRYPNYKFTPKKRTSAARPYKKRPDTELIARDFDDKQQLLSLYHHGKDIGPSEKNSLINYIENTKKTPAKKTITKIKKRNTDSDIINFNCSPSSSNSDPYQISSMEDNSLFYNSQLICPTDAASSLSSLSLLSHHSVYSPSMASVSSNNGSHSSLLQDFIDPASSYLVNCAAAFFTTTTTTTTDCFMNQAFSLFSTASDPIFDNGTRMMIGPFSTHGHNMLPVYHQQQEDAYSSPPAPAQLLTQPFFYNQQQ